MIKIAVIRQYDNAVSIIPYLKKIKMGNKNAKAIITSDS
jgi:hypothetical protein